MKSTSGPTWSKWQSRFAAGTKQISVGIHVACRSRPLSLLHCNSSGWHEDPRYGCFWGLDSHCCGDPSFEEVVRSGMSHSRLCLNGVVDLCALARTPSHEGGIRSGGRWLSSEKLFWNGLRRLSCCCYCWSATMALLRRIGGRRESVFLMQVPVVGAEVDRNGYGDRDDHAARMAGHRL